MKRNIGGRLGGFTLVELMIVVGIIGVLAALAIPAFSKYMKRSRTSEALASIRHIYDNEVAYYNADHVDRDGILITSQFLTTPFTPASVPSGTKTVGNYDVASWRDLNFSMDGPTYFSFQAISAGLGTASEFTARAMGDLDGDNIYSTFERSGDIDPVTGDVVQSGGIYINNAIE